jgi:hypothetical protein
VPAIGRDHAAVGNRGIVDDGADRVRIFYGFNYLRPLGSGSPLKLYAGGT